MNENETEKPQDVNPPAETVSDKLPRREALAKAISEHRETQPAAAPAPAAAADPAPTAPEVRAAVDADVEPPAEFSPAAKEAWRNQNYKIVQQEYRRIHDLRTQEVTRAQREAREAQQKVEPATKLIDSVRSYLTLRGDGSVPTEQQVAEAVQLVQELKRNPKGARAELERLGFDFTGDGAARIDDTKIVALQKQIEALQQKEQARTFDSVREQFTASFAKLGAEKTRTGDPVFPDLFDPSEAGKQFATDLGSLAADARFVQGVLRRIPDADHSVICREAYKYLGGRVSGSETSQSSVSKSTSDIDKKRRAAASTPGPVAPSRNGDALKGKLSRRAAIQKAIEEQREH